MEKLALNLNGEKKIDAAMTQLKEKLQNSKPIEQQKEIEKPIEKEKKVEVKKEQTKEVKNEGKEVQKDEEYITCGNPVQIKEWAKMFFGEWKKSLHWEEKEAIKNYTDNGYKKINKAMREGGKVKWYVQDRIDKITNALNRTQIPHNLKVYRSASYHTLGEYKTLPPEQLVGKVLTDKAFISTTMRYDVAVGFSNDVVEATTLGLIRPKKWWDQLTRKEKLPKYLEEGILMTIKIPEGTKGAYIGNLSTRFDINTHEGEEEVLLQRDTKMKITSARASGERLLLECEVIK